MRLRVPATEDVAWNDLVQGEMSFPASSLGDPVLMGPDGAPSQEFAAAVDDAKMHISHVLRGIEHLERAPVQLLLYDAFGLPRPEYGHLPAITGLDGLDRVLDGLEVPLGRLAAGTHSLVYEIHASVAAGDSSAACAFTRQASLAFTVGAVPPPGPACDSLPHVTEVQIGPPVDCAGADCVPGICPGDRIPLHVAGWFPNGCYRFAGLDLLPGPEAGPLPAPPIVRLRVTRAVCSPCTQAIVPWSADTVLAGLPGGAYQLRLELVRTDLCHATPVDTLYCGTRQPFAVRDSCGSTPAPCLVADWDHAGQVGGCDDFIVPGGSA